MAFKKTGVSVVLFPRIFPFLRGILFHTEYRSARESRLTTTMERILTRNKGATASSSLRKISEQLQNILRTFPPAHAYSSFTQGKGTHRKGGKEVKNVIPRSDRAQI
jgi:hypothetical protein